MNPYLKNAILNSEQAYEADRLEIESGTPSFKLMQTAGEKVAEAAEKMISRNSEILVVCSVGNNAGDGFVAAKELVEKGHKVTVAGIIGFDSLKNDALKAFSELKKPKVQIEEKLNKSHIKNKKLIIDAIFGVGLAREVDGEFAKAIELINESEAKVLSVDIPSGICANSGNVMGAAVQVDKTITFFHPKLGHYLLPGKKYCGEIEVADIGIKQKHLEKIQPKISLNSPELWQGYIRKPGLEDNKYTIGHVLINGSPIECTGATKLAAFASERAGAGMVTVACDRESLPVYASSFTSIMNKIIDQDKDFFNYIKSKKVKSVLLGPGNGLAKELRRRVQEVLKLEIPCVIDADAISVFEDDPDELFEFTHENAVLTPHEGEFARIFNLSGSKVDRALKAAQIANCIFVLKGNDTVIAHPGGRAVINVNTSPDLAKAGSGDILAGIITSLLAQGTSTFEAACAGVWKHEGVFNQLIG
jgi:hydroxyethylthiazole kinase-like uncharacterized protein yjeF